MTWVNFQTVRENLDVSSVLNHYGFDTKQNGRDQLKICCPFHDDKNPSCGFNTKKKVFNCFSCGEKGNILDFVAQMEGYDPAKPRELRKAALFAVETFGIDGGTREDENSSQPKAKSRRQKARNGQKRGAEPSKKADQPDPSISKATPRPEAHTAREEGVNAPLTFELKLDGNHSFLRDRKVAKEVVEEFGLGYAKRGSMKGRVCFPIHNEAGELIAYAGRWADDDLPADTPRYLLPKGFEKSRVLFNLNRVSAERARLSREGQELDDCVVVVEGYWSVLRLHPLGVPVVACFGDSLSPEQVELLVAEGFAKAMLIFDGDEGGRTGTEHALSVLARRMFTKTIMLDDGDKPDTMSEKIVSALPRYVPADIAPGQ